MTKMIYNITRIRVMLSLKEMTEIYKMDTEGYEKICDYNSDDVDYDSRYTSDKENYDDATEQSDKLNQSDDATFIDDSIVIRYPSAEKWNVQSFPSLTEPQINILKQGIQQICYQPSNDMIRGLSFTSIKILDQVMYILMGYTHSAKEDWDVTIYKCS